MAICSQNGEHDLRLVLQSLVPQLQPGVSVEIVDSGSDARSSEMLRTLAGQFGVEYVREDRAGLSIARNLALARCDAEWLALLDDDAVPFPDYVATMRRALGRHDGSVAALSGKVVPRWPDKATPGSLSPERIGPRWRVLLSLVEDEDSRETTSVPLAVGANLLFRTKLLRDIGGFPPFLGRVGKTLISGEERYVLERLTSAGYRTFYDGSIGVEHIIKTERLTPRWVARRAFREGQVNFTMDRGRTGRKAYLTAKSLAAAPVLAALALSSRSGDDIVRLFHNIGYLSGNIAGLAGKAGG